MSVCVRSSLVFLAVATGLAVAPGSADAKWVMRGYFGVVVFPEQKARVQVSSVVPYGPAHEAGVRPGDYITHVGSVRVYSVDQLSRRLQIEGDKNAGLVPITIARWNGYGWVYADPMVQLEWAGGYGD